MDTGGQMRNVWLRPWREEPCAHHGAAVYHRIDNNTPDLWRL
jgi:hypothetical protein